MVYGVYEGLPLEYPKFIAHASGSHIYDIDSNDFIDYHLAFGPVILGHAYPAVNDAVKLQMDKGVIFGINHESELELSEKLVKHVPCAEMVGIMNTGSDATSAAVRIARIHTGREKIIKFSGAYHGWHDWSTIGGNFGGGVTIHPGVPKGMIGTTIVLPWNDLEIVEKVMVNQGHEVAAIITEPYMFNGGVIPPEKGYLQGLRKLTKDYGSLLIFDEVITGFRLGLAGGQGMLGVTPDLATFAKAMANGYTISAFAGKKEILDPLTGRAWVGGTYNSNPIGTSAALATIKELEKEGNWSHLYSVGRGLMKGVEDAMKDSGIQGLVQGPGPGLSIFFTPKERVVRPEDIDAPFHPHIMQSVIFYREMIKRGCFLCPARIGRVYVSVAHTEEDIQRTIEAAGEALKAAAKIQ
jgi:glutamate-1-semialdehyde 2,1-aminomutase